MTPNQKALLLSKRGARPTPETGSHLGSPAATEVQHTEAAQPPMGLVPNPPSAHQGLVPNPQVELSALPITPSAEQFTHLSEKQFGWLSWRLGVDTDEEASEATGVDPLEPLQWRGAPEFEALYQRSLENKREAFRVLGTHLLPKALRVINRLLEADSFKANQTGLQLLLKTQALLDQPQKDQSDRIVQLLDSLRAPGQAVLSAVEPRA